MGPGEWIVIGLCVLVGLGFIIGREYNQRQMAATFQWLRSSLKQLGNLSETRWIDPASCGTRLTLKSKSQPFELLDLVILLPRRENLPLWLFQAIQGKRDGLLVNAVMTKPPQADLYAIHQGDQQTFRALVRGDAAPLDDLGHYAGFALYGRGAPDMAALQRIKQTLDVLGESTVRLSLQHKAPHLTFYGRLAHIKSNPASQFYETLCKLA